MSSKLQAQTLRSCTSHPLISTNETCWTCQLSNPKKNCCGLVLCGNLKFSCNQNLAYSICPCTSSHSTSFTCLSSFGGHIQFLSIVVQWESCGFLDPWVPFEQHVHHAYIWWVPKLHATPNYCVIGYIVELGSSHYWSSS